MTDFSERLERLRSLMETTGYRFVETDILQPAETFIDLAGEELRGRLFLTATVGGAELCLRPDFTIPVCSHHIASGDPARAAAYSYLGPVFRQRPGGTGEFPQAGIESLGREDREGADAEALTLALSCLRAFDLESPDIRLGDQALFFAFVDGLDLAAIWKRRLKAAFGDRARLNALIEQLAGRGPGGEDRRAGLLAALEGVDHEAARDLVEDLLSIAGIATVGGRTANEIAERFLEQATFAAGSSARPEIAELMTAFLDVAGTPDVVADRLAVIAADAGVDLTAALEAFNHRAQLIADRGIAYDRMRFAADFGRRLDYYTGFVFEIFDPARPDLGPLVGGGRYDKLLALLGAPCEVPAVGFSIWIERVPGGVAALGANGLGALT
ncbi:ATP phosphoribosyltransferase regulatory subunit [Rhodobium gokarnense]|uniref:ATP phosphoribosyltransferase regulatory subunit n=1 Tax=Rhodobium gokarnense TaxID=364296 RepID=A0ABT3HCL1_9HYPH|nr:ATP phosphoribosyltransferase regulatory subunit [Rhodobium gokarnense]MCW2308142.1 ATP phosphoribosyltransferase regulatory subunit [Rhodobium gokarnense]